MLYKKLLVSSLRGLTLSSSLSNSKSVHATTTHGHTFVRTIPKLLPYIAQSATGNDKSKKNQPLRSTLAKRRLTNIPQDIRNEQTTF